jgi:hypothetical protein
VNGLDLVDDRRVVWTEAFARTMIGGWNWRSGLTGQVLNSEGGFGSIRSLRHGREPS